MMYKQIFQFSDFYLFQEFAFPFIPVFLFLWIFYSARASEEQGTEAYVKQNRNFIVMIFMTFFLLYAMSKDIARMMNIKKRYDNREYSVAEGKVTDVVGSINNSNNTTHVAFTVNGIQFSYSKNIFGACFSRVKSNQQKISENGKELKIYYIDSCIVEVWVKER